MTNRERLERVIKDIGIIKDDPTISPTPFEYLLDAEHAITQAWLFALDTEEHDQPTRAHG